VSGRQGSRNEPGWCVRQDHGDGGGIRHHVSEPVRVGNEHGSGQVSLWLTQGDQGERRLLVNVAHAASASVDINLDDAARLRDGLTELLEQAGYEP
jgi:hypothetical protein